MNDNFRHENQRCGDAEALVAYLYNESDPAEREAMAAHVARCASCTEEIESLRATRTMLAAWTPPEASLGFQITRADEREPSTVLRPAAWWRQPLPAWAQAAAALLIFAAGLTVGGARGASATQAVATTPPAAIPQVALAPAVSRDDLARLEQRLRTVETARVQAASVQPSVKTVDETALLRQVEALVAASEERQQETYAQLVNAVRRLDLQQRVDLRQVGDTLGRMHNTTQAELGRQTNAINVVLTSLSSGGAAR